MKFKVGDRIMFTRHVNPGHSYALDSRLTDLQIGELYTIEEVDSIDSYTYQYNRVAVKGCFNYISKLCFSNSNPNDK